MKLILKFNTLRFVLMYTIINGCHVYKTFLVGIFEETSPYIYLYYFLKYPKLQRLDITNMGQLIFIEFIDNCDTLNYVSEILHDTMVYMYLGSLIIKPYIFTIILRIWIHMKYS